MRRVDFHLPEHAVKGQGMHSFREVAHFLQDASVEICAVTDHDTIISTSKFEAQAWHRGIKLIKATEISTTGKELLLPDMHILGYGISDLDSMEKVFNSYKAYNENVCKEVILKLQKEGYDINLVDVKVAQAGNYLTKRDIARYMVAHGYARTNKEVYDLYIGRDRPSYIPIAKLTIEEAIELIKGCGGIAVLAHPGKLPKSVDMENVFATLKKLGLSGVETITTRHSDSEMKYYSMLAKKYSLIETCGTDFHRITTDRIPGYEVEDDFISPFLDALGL